jgi:hypothetical protein
MSYPASRLLVQFRGQTGYLCAKIRGGRAAVEAAASIVHRINLELTDFAWSALSAEAEKQGVSVEELVQHAAMYYLADLDSGRVAAQVFRAERTGQGPEPREGESRRRRFEPSDSD